MGQVVRLFGCGHFNPRSPCGERQTCSGMGSSSRYFNPRSPCGERPELMRLTIGSTRTISIHAPRVGSDAGLRGDFMSKKISIHAPRVGSDGGRGEKQREVGYFNPRSPCGERHHLRRELVPGFLFQSTLPVWGATPPCACAAWTGRISIHAPRVGSDNSQTKSFLFCTVFQSTLPVWGATYASTWLNGRRWISIHAPRVGSDGLPAYTD